MVNEKTFDKSETEMEIDESIAEFENSQEIDSDFPIVKFLDDLNGTEKNDSRV